jgi:hypothetical protein
MKPLLATIYKKSFWNTYDHIGKLLLVNLLWFVIFPLPTFLCFRYVPLTGLGRIAATLLVGIMTHSYAAAGVFGLTARLVDYQKVGLRRFFGEAETFFFRTLALTLIYGTAFFLLFNGVRFYAGIKIGGGILGFFLAGWQVCIIALGLLVQVYLLPLLVTKNWGVLRVIKWSAILTVLKPGFTVFAFLQAIGIFIILTVTGVGAVLLVLSLTSIFLNTTLRETWKEIEARWKARKKPTSWKEVFEERDIEDEERRALKDIFRPWDM